MEYVQNYDGNAWDNHPIQAAMLLDSAATFSGKTRVVVSTGKAYVSNDVGETFTPAENLVGTSQCAVIFGKERESIALVGGFAGFCEAVVSTNGVAYSTDDGAKAQTPRIPYTKVYWGSLGAWDGALDPFVFKLKRVWVR